VARIYTRATIVWFVVAGITGGISVFLHLVREHVARGGSGSPIALTLLAFGMSAVTAVLVFHGIMVAAYEQDEASRRRRG
jgi:hypothetical protein